MVERREEKTPRIDSPGRRKRSTVRAARLSALALAAGALTLACAPGGPPAHASDELPTAIENVRVFDGMETIDRATVLIEGTTIAAVGRDVKVPARAIRIDGSGHTLLPGLIDGHTHSFGTALEDALAWGVTTSLDMFTDVGAARALREEQQAGPVHDRSDLFSAGTLITAEGGHGTQYGIPVPTLDRTEDADAHIAARLEEGSDYIKIVLEDGSVIGRELNTLSDATAHAAIRAAQKRDRLAVVHVTTLAKARVAVAGGADGLVHIYNDAGPDPQLVQAAAKSGLFVVPTLTVIESITGARAGVRLASDEAIAAHLSPDQRSSLNGSFGGSESEEGAARFREVLATVRALHEAGVPILAGTDAPNPGTGHGVSMHREMELLVQAGLTPIEALSAATGRIAEAFRLKDRGRIAAGRKADLLLVEGDPTRNIQQTRAIRGIWKDGARFERPTYAMDEEPMAELGPGVVSNFDEGSGAAAFGSWIESTDRMAGGQSTLSIGYTEEGADGSAGAMVAEGELKAGFAFPWSGPMFAPGSRPMEAVDLSAASGVRFWVRGEGSIRVMMFATRLGRIPAQTEVKLTPEWKRHTVTFEQLGIDGSDLMGLQFSAAENGPFRFELDDVAFVE